MFDKWNHCWNSLLNHFSKQTLEITLKKGKGINHPLQHCWCVAPCARSTLYETKTESELKWSEIAIKKYKIQSFEANLKSKAFTSKQIINFHLFFHLYLPNIGHPWKLSWICHVQISIFCIKKPNWSPLRTVCVIHIHLYHTVLRAKWKKGRWLYKWVTLFFFQCLKERILIYIFPCHFPASVFRKYCIVM